MELHEALSQITEIRQQMARTEVFRGYRAGPVAFSGVLAVSASLTQGLWLPYPAQRLGAYLGLWVGTAIVSGAAAGLGMFLRAKGPGRSLRREITWLAIEQFVPCIAAGALLTIVLVRSAPEASWMLPGLWQIMYSLGIFASCRLLPRATFGVALFYLLTGLTTLTLAKGDAAFSPWAMGLSFGVGQFLAASILYRTLEYRDDHS
ncbi:MAG: hypothetical protein AB7I30_17865 [Isosphaeraceae bacterium]